MNSRNKGKRGEREAAKAFEEYIGVSLRRTAQVDGGLSADLVGAEGLHLEVKRRARIAATDFMDQAVRDSKNTNNTPVVLMRQDQHPDWLCVVRLQDLVQFARTILEVRIKERAKNG